MARALVVSQTGGPEVLVPQEVEIPAPGAGQLLVKVAASGVNFIDIYHRQGTYPLELPFTPGLEGSGTVAEVGSGVADFVVGDRVAWPQAFGSYATHIVVDAQKVVPVPEDVDLLTAAAIPLQALTAHALVTSAYPVKEGDTVLVHAAAGGVGLLLTQLAKARGATVLATVSTPEKAALATKAGADHILSYANFAEEAKALTDGKGVHAVYDGVGKDTFDASLASLRTRGTLVLFGGASGQVPPFDIQRLNAGGSLTLIRPSLFHYIADHDEFLWRAAEVFEAIHDGTLAITIGGTYPLAQASQAHADLAARKTTGKLLLLPE